MRRILTIVCLAFGLVAPITFVSGAASFADPTFQQQWKAGEAIAPNFWGPLSAARDGLQEPYKESAGGQRLVQYFDKARMELGANGTVTNGLLAKELVTGRIQTGNDTFSPLAPPSIEIAGDPGGGAPTYAQFATTAVSLMAQTTAKIGQPLTATIVAGKVQIGDGSATGQGLTLMAFDSLSGHNILGPFAKYRDRVGLSTVGLAISEPFVSTFNVGGVARLVAIEFFERRVLTYNPLNTPDFQVEMGNVGRQYAQWRYGNAPPPTAPVAPTTVPATAPPPATGQFWTDPAGRLSLRYPASWHIDQSLNTRASDVLGLSSANGNEILSLSISPQDSLSLSEHARIGEAAAKAVLSNVQATDPTFGSIGGEPTAYVTFAGSSPGTIGANRVGSYAIVFHNGLAYEFNALGTGEDPTGFGTIVGQIMGSVTFLR